MCKICMNFSYKIPNSELYAALFTFAAYSSIYRATLEMLVYVKY